MEKISRRSLIKGIGAATVTVVAGACDRGPGEPTATRSHYLFFAPDEGAFIEAAVARLIPADDTGPGALEADVPIFIDRQLAGAWGAGEQLYRSGPWVTDAPSETGYQLPFTPAELFRKALRAIAEELQKTNRGGLAALSLDEQDAFLTALEKQPRDLGGVPSDVFFSSLLDMTVEGFFADPVYGGNKNMVAWRMIGFPGAYANYYDLVDQHGIAFNRSPVSLGQDRRGVIHLDPVSTKGS
jgi:gluconate 2-dehydrogenase gamma chain